MKFKLHEACYDHRGEFLRDEFTDFTGIKDEYYDHTCKLIKSTKIRNQKEYENFLLELQFAQDFIKRQKERKDAENNDSSIKSTDSN